MSNSLYSKKVIADLFNLSERRIEQLTQQKIIPKAERGKYDLGPTVKAYIMYLQQRLSGGGEVIDIAQVKEAKLEAEMRERRARANIAEIHEKRLKGEYMRKEEVIKEWTSRCVEVRSAFQNLPQEVGFLFSDSEYRAEIEETMTKWVMETLTRYGRVGICTPGENGEAAAEGGEFNSPKKKRRSRKKIEEEFEDAAEDGLVF